MEMNTISPKKKWTQRMMEKKQTAWWDLKPEELEAYIAKVNFEIREVMGENRKQRTDLF